MGKEIERKFLVTSNDFKKNCNRERYRQGFLSIDPERVVRIRSTASRAYLTLKGKRNSMMRKEFEYEIPMADALEILSQLCIKPIIEKYRYKIKIGNHLWEIDEFLGANKGLIIAEVELQNEKEAIDWPHWVGREVTNDSRYYNNNLVQNPYQSWEVDE